MSVDRALSVLMRITLAASFTYAAATQNVALMIFTVWFDYKRMRDDEREKRR